MVWTRVRHRLLLRRRVRLLSTTTMAMRMKTATSTVSRMRRRKVSLRTNRTSTVPMVFRLVRARRLVRLVVVRVATVVRVLVAKAVDRVDVVAVAVVVRVRAAELLRVAARLRAAIASLVSFAKNGNWVALRRGPFAFRGA